jgi:hypothetical protein
MKKRKTLLAAAAAITSLVSTGQAATVTVTGGDLILSFRSNVQQGVDGDTSKGNDLLVNLGSASFLASLGVGTYNLNAGSVFYTGNASADDNGFGLSQSQLVSVFGAGWNLDSTLAWSAIGYEDNGINNTLFVSSLISSLSRRPLSSQVNLIEESLVPILIGLDATEQLVAGIDSAVVRDDLPASYTQKVLAGGSADYNYAGWGPTNIEAGAPQGGIATANFFALPNALNEVGPNSTVPTAPKGFFSLSSDGTLTYTVVPEPTSAALLVAAAAGALSIRRRRKKQ